MNRSDNEDTDASQLELSRLVLDSLLELSRLVLASRLELSRLVLFAPSFERQWAPSCRSTHHLGGCMPVQKTKKDLGFSQSVDAAWILDSFRSKTRYIMC